MRNPDEDDLNQDLIKPEEFIRPETAGRKILWNQFKSCTSIKFEKELPFYILNQEGEYPKTWFAANEISKI